MATSVTAGVQQITVAVDNPNRDDLGGLKIWMSTTSGFTPASGNLVYDGPDLTVVLTGLPVGTTQYLKLALYSAIDPSDFDYSAQYSATPTAPVVAAGNISGTITDAQIAGLAASKVTGQLTNAQLAAIDAAKVTGAIASTQIADNAITTPKIATGAVTSSEIAANTITAGNIAAGTITATQLSAGAVTTAKIAAGAITANELGANSVIAGKIATNAVTAGTIAAGAVTASKIAADAITADNVNAGTLRGSNVFAGSFATKGSTLTAGSSAGATTLNLQSTTDFPASGNALIFSSTLARDRDTITYTGKTATTLTGVSGALAHSAGEVIIPLTKTIVLDQNVSEMRFYSDRGDGTIEEMANIGQVSTAPSGTIVDDAIVALGSYHSSFDKVPLHVRASQTYGLYVHRQGSPSGNQPVGLFLSGSNTGGPALWAEIQGSNNTYAFFALTGSAGTAVRGQGGSGSANGLDGQAFGSGYGVRGKSANGVGVWAEATNTGVPLQIVSGTAPTTGIDIGSVYVSAFGDFYGHDGSTWRQFLRTSDTIKAAAGSATSPGLTFGSDTNTGLYRKAADTIAFTTAGTESGSVSGAGNWTFVGSGTFGGNVIAGGGEVLAGSNGIRIGATGALGSTNLHITKDITGATTAHGALMSASVLADVTNVAYGYRTSISTANAADMNFLIHFGANNPSIGTGSNIAQHVGFNAGTDLTASGASTDRVYGFRGAVVANGVKAYNLYMEGTAPNFLQGDTSFAQAVSVTGQSTLTGAVVTSAIGPTAARQHTLPNVASDTIALLDATQTFGGAKTFSSTTTFNGNVDYRGADITNATFANPATGSTVSLTTSQRHYVVTAAKGTLTIHLPAAIANGHMIRISADGAITTLTLADNAGVTTNVRNAPGSLAAGESAEFVYRIATGQWYRCG